jgi:predicted lipoprotein with Yx(FWY)xxD motif
MDLLRMPRAAYSAPSTTGGAVGGRVASRATTRGIPPFSIAACKCSSTHRHDADHPPIAPRVDRERRGPRGARVSTAKTSLGRILVDARGHTLYLFGKDKNGKSACSGACAAAWPPLIATAKPRARDGAEASRLGTTRRADGRLQVTYNRHPVYTFVKDTKKGQTNGEGLKAFGATWDALSAAGAKVVKHGAQSSPGGY